MGASESSPPWNATMVAAVAEVANVAEARRGTTLRDTHSVALRLASRALELFIERGIDRVTVADVAAVASVTSRTFFRYFPTKETVVLDLWDSTHERLIVLINTTPDASTVPEALEVAIEAWYHQFGDLFPILNNLTFSSPSLEAAMLRRTLDWELHLADALARRFDHLDDVDARIWSALGFALLKVAGNRAIQDGVSFDQASAATFRRFSALMESTARLDL